MCKDVLGNIIKEGDMVVLAIRSGNSAELVVRKIVGFDEKGYAITVNPKTGFKGRGANTSNMAVVDETA